MFKSSGLIIHLRNLLKKNWNFRFFVHMKWFVERKKEKKFRVLVHDKRNLKIIPVQQSQLDVVETEEHTGN